MSSVRVILNARMLGSENTLREILRTKHPHLRRKTTAYYINV